MDVLRIYNNQETVCFNVYRPLQIKYVNGVLRIYNNQETVCFNVYSHFIEIN